ncbi:MAG: type II toxin-antitoxin system Phd/YefM family antitoxin [Pseudomonadota bacterium]|nr:type II toxin-antitoxin system Phd/YefM family antitoxin [Pseudomonadota bacterium]
MKNILQALDRNESVTILYHGRAKAIMTPIVNIDNMSIENHPFFGMNAELVETVDETVNRLRGGRY